MLRRNLLVGLLGVAGTAAATGVSASSESPYASNVTRGYEILKSGDFAAAYELLAPAAQAGDKDAQFLMGEMYRLTPQLDNHIEKAQQWYTKAAAQGHAQANQRVNENVNQRFYDEMVRNESIIPEDSEYVPEPLPSFDDVQKMVANGDVALATPHLSRLMLDEKNYDAAQLLLNIYQNGKGDVPADPAMAQSIKMILVEFGDSTYLADLGLPEEYAEEMKFGEPMFGEREFITGESHTKIFGYKANSQMAHGNRGQVLHLVTQQANSQILTLAQQLETALGYDSGFHFEVIELDLNGVTPTGEELRALTVFDNSVPVIPDYEGVYAKRYGAYQTPALVLFDEGSEKHEVVGYGSNALSGLNQLLAAKANQ